MSRHAVASRPAPIGLRIWEPEQQETPAASDAWTIRKVFEEFRRPELASVKSKASIELRIDRWEEFEAEQGRPVAVARLSSANLRDFQAWLAKRYPLPKGASSINKCLDEIERVLKLARSEALEVGPYRAPGKYRVGNRPRFYFTDEQVERLWLACDAMQWPPKGSFRTYPGSGLEPPTFWRAVLILLRNYGMRVQDLIAYSSGKTPLLWKNVSFDELSPNVESQEVWPFGWMQYIASKTKNSSGRRYVLPLTPSARGAFERLKLGASEGKPACPVLHCPKGKGLSKHWRLLQKIAGVETRTTEPYILEDFRKTVGTASMCVHADLPFALCGWGRSADVGDKHYKNPEPLLVQNIMKCPLPACFDEWS